MGAVPRSLAALAALVTVVSACAAGTSTGQAHVSYGQSFTFDTGLPTAPVTTAPTLPSASPSPARFSVPAERAFASADGNRSPFADFGATVALVRGVSPLAALHAVDSHPPTPIESPARAESWADDTSTDEIRSAIRARRIGGGWTLLVDDAGYRMTEPAVVERLSAHGVAVVMWQNVEAVSRFQFARRGRLIRQFDPLLYNAPGVGHPSAAERRLRFDDGSDLHPMTKSVLLTYRLTGIRLTLATVLSRRHAVAMGLRNY